MKCLTLAIISSIPDFDLMFKGSDALERKGVFYTVSDMDHPITKLLQSPYKVPRKSNVLISLSTKVVPFMQPVIFSILLVAGEIMSFRQH